MVRIPVSVETLLKFVPRKRGQSAGRAICRRGSRAKRAGCLESRSSCSWSFSFGLRLKRSAALQPCPSARPGVARARAAGAEGDHPPDKGALNKRASARALTTLVVMKILGAEDRAYLSGRHRQVLHPCPREGGALSSRRERGRLCRSEAKASRQSRDPFKKAPEGRAVIATPE